jgi:putative acetyltransferase
MLRLIPARSPEDLRQARRLFEEYALSLGIDLSFQGFAEELAGLPGGYAPPTGCLLLAIEDGEAQGCVGVRSLGGESCELKRLYVRPAHRGEGVGRALAEAAIAEARRSGYRRMLLDTLPGMDRAQALYRALGFGETAPYRENPVPGAAFFFLELGPAASGAPPAPPAVA